MPMPLLTIWYELADRARDTVMNEVLSLSLLSVVNVLLVTFWLTDMQMDRDEQHW